MGWQTTLIVLVTIFHCCVASPSFEPCEDGSRRGTLAVINTFIADLKTIGDEDIGVSGVTIQDGFNCDNIVVNDGISDIAVIGEVLTFTLRGFSVDCFNDQKTIILKSVGSVSLNIASADLKFSASIDTSTVPHQFNLDCDIAENPQFTPDFTGFTGAANAIALGLNTGALNFIVVGTVKDSLCAEVGGMLWEAVQYPLGNISVWLDEARENFTTYTQLADHNELELSYSEQEMQRLMNYELEDEITLVHDIINKIGTARTSGNELSLNRILKAWLFPDEATWRPFEKVPEGLDKVLDLLVENSGMSVSVGVNDVQVAGIDKLSGVTVNTASSTTWEASTGIDFGELTLRVPAVVNIKPRLRPGCNMLKEEFTAKLAIDNLALKLPVTLPIVQSAMNDLPISGLVNTNLSCLATSFLESPKVNPRLTMQDAFLVLSDIQDPLLDSIARNFVTLLNIKYKPVLLEALPGIVMGLKSTLDSLVKETFYDTAECVSEVEPNTGIEAISHLTLGYVLEPERDTLEHFLRYESQISNVPDVFGLSRNGLITGGLELVENLDPDNFQANSECTAFDILGEWTKDGIDPPWETSDSPTAAPTTISERSRASFEFELLFAEIASFNLSDILGQFQLRGEGDATVFLNYSSPRPLDIGFGIRTSLYNTTIEEAGVDLAYDDTLMINATITNLDVMLGALLPFSSPKVSNTTFGGLAVRPLRCLTSTLASSPMITPAIRVESFDSPNGADFLEDAIRLGAEYVFLLPDWRVSEALTEGVTNQLIDDIVELILNFLDVRDVSQVNELLDSLTSLADLVVNVAVAEYWLQTFCPEVEVIQDQSEIGFNYVSDQIFSGVRSMLDTCILPTINDGLLAGLTQDQSGIKGKLILTDLFDPIELEIPKDGLDFSESNKNGGSHRRRLDEGNSTTSGEVSVFYLELVSLTVDNLNTFNNTVLIASSDPNPYTLDNGVDVGFDENPIGLAVTVKVGLDGALNEFTFGVSMDLFQFYLSTLLKFNRNRVNDRQLSKIDRFDCWVSDLDEGSVDELVLLISQLVVKFDCLDCSNNAVLQEFSDRAKVPEASEEINQILNDWFARITSRVQAEGNLDNFDDEINSARESCLLDEPQSIIHEGDHGFAEGGLELMAMVLAGLSMAGSASCCFRTYKGHRYKKGQAIIDMGLEASQVNDADDPWEAAKQRAKRMNSDVSSLQSSDDGAKSTRDQFNRDLLRARLTAFLQREDKSKVWSPEGIDQLVQTVGMDRNGRLVGFIKLNKQLEAWTGNNLGRADQFIISKQANDDAASVVSNQTRGAGAVAIDVHRLRQELAVFLEENDHSRSWDEFAIEELVGWVVRPGRSKADPQTGFRRLNSQLHKLYGNDLGKFTRFRITGDLEDLEENVPNTPQLFQSSAFGAFGRNQEEAEDEVGADGVLPTLGRSWKHFVHGVPEDYREIASLSEHPHIPKWMRLSAPIVLILNLVFFVTGDLSVGARVDIFIQVIGYPVELLGFAEFSLVSSVRDLWEAGAYPLALLIGTLSGAWPYAKTLLMTYCWFARPSSLGHERRTTILTYLDMFGKFALVEVYFLVLVMVAFRLSALSPRIGVLPDDLYSADIIVAPIWGLYAFCIASGLSLLLSNVMLVFNHHIQEERTIEHEDREVERKLGQPISQRKKNDPEMHAVVMSQHSYRVVALEEYRFSITRLGQFALFGALLVSVLVVIIGGFYPSLRIETIGVIRNIIEIGEPKEGEDAPFAYPTNDLSLWSIASKLWTLNDFGKGDATLGTLFLLTLYVFSTVFFPLIQVVGVMAVWIRPVTLKSLKKFLVVNEVISAWCGLEVFLVSILVGVLELGQVSEYLLAEQCTDIVPVLENVVVKLGIIQYEGDRVLCFRLNPEVQPGAFMLITGIIGVNLLVQLVLHLAHLAVCDLEHSRLLFKVNNARIVSGGTPSPMATPQTIPHYIVGTRNLGLALDGNAPEVEMRSGVAQKLLRGLHWTINKLGFTQFVNSDEPGPWQFAAKRLSGDEGAANYVNPGSVSPLISNPLFANSNE